MKLQQFIINESILDKGILKVCFMGGHSGSGKSYVLSHIADGAINPRIVNTDKFTEMTHTGKDDESWERGEDLVKTLTKAQLSNYINSMLPLWVDGTSGSPKSLFKREGLLKSFGYDTAMVWVTTSLETSLRRAEDREKLIGRHVDPEFIKDAYRKADDMKNYYKTHFSPFLEVHNDDGEFTDKVMLDAFRKMSHFFLEPPRNPIGIELIKDMKDKGYKYLIDNPKVDMQEIHKAVDIWYKR